MSLWSVIHTFLEKRTGKEVLWYEKDYKSVRYGGDGIHTGHVEVETHLHLIKQAIEQPDKIREDKDYPNRTCYYVRFNGDSTYPPQYMKVIVGKNWRGKLVIVTAHFRKNLQPGEKNIWSKN